MENRMENEMETGIIRLSCIGGCVGDYYSG